MKGGGGLFLVIQNQSKINPNAIQKTAAAFALKIQLLTLNSRAFIKRVIIDVDFNSFVL
jgi:DNA helicase HerA-like ATPase